MGWYIDKSMGYISYNKRILLEEWKDLSKICLLREKDTTRIKFVVFFKVLLLLLLLE